MRRLRGLTVVGYVCVFLLLILFASNGASAEGVSGGPSFVVGLPFIAVGFASYNEIGNIQSMLPVNWLLGVSYRSYMGQGLRHGLFTPFWGIGTIILLLPYWEAGMTFTIHWVEELNS